MPECDLLVRGARAAGSEEPVDLAALDGEIIAIGAGIDAREARTEIDARGLFVLPGGVDPHVHFNEPGARSHWEGFASGSSALAAGGVTTTLEMPLNASPPTTTPEAFDAKRAAAERVSRVDFGLWGGIVPGNVEQLEPLACRGVIGFKAFMSTSGSDDFPASDDLTLYEAMSVISGLGLLVAVHAESEEITRGLAQRARAAGRVAIRDYLSSRPAVAETEAIASAIELAAVTGCPLHVVHVSTGRGAALVAEARARGLDVTCEVTPHHLVLTDEDTERLGVVAKCAPPLRPAGELAALWEALARGEVSFVASDHSPSPPELKEGDAFAAWGGIAACQSSLELLLTEGYGRGRLTLARVAEAFAGAAARRYRLDGKGTLEVGMDADLALVDIGPERVLERSELRDRHRMSPYVGRTLSARVAWTILRGEPIYRVRELVGVPRGRLVGPGTQPSRAASPR
ncbi:MAG: allantoinase AllB [Actinomycetota bacterium]|nr:allantoinase AllB [Actinomycetota bacterium]